LDEQALIADLIRESSLCEVLDIGCGGSVAKTIAEDGRTGINWIRSPLCGGIEKSGKER
jgi:2-polyprenyl-3-methyl-5-hydroxy-6-metoxy-1,4-benzoquinol methylase